MRVLRPIYLQLRYNSLLTFVFVGFGTWMLEKIANQFWQWRGVPGLLVAILAPVAIVIIYRSVLWGINKFVRGKPPSVGIPPTPCRGLILLFGREVTAREAIKPHRDHLDFIWFILTDQTKTEYDKLPAYWWGRAISTPELIHDPYKPDETGNAIERALSHAQVLGLTVQDLVCDLTGGTTAMTIGAFVACTKSGLPTQMVPGEYDKARKAIRPLDPIQLNVAHKC